MTDEEQLVVICTLHGSHIVWKNCTGGCDGYMQEGPIMWCCRCYRCGEYYTWLPNAPVPFLMTVKTLEEWNDELSRAA